MKDSKRSRGSSKRNLVAARTSADDAVELFGHLLEGAMAHPDLAPDRLIVISLSQQNQHRILTKKRLELLRAMKTREIESISELAKAVGRSLESVSRDLRALQSAGLIEFRREGTTKRPILTKDLILMPIA